MALDPLVQRAIAAYYRAEDIPDQPSATTSDVVTYQDRTYVVLRNRHRTLAVYRVRPVDGVLRRMKRWPTELETY
jgi:hypothetical protein